MSQRKRSRSLSATGSAPRCAGAESGERPPAGTGGRAPAMTPCASGTGLSDPQDLTRLLRAWSDGERRALEELMPLVYDELRRLARSQMRRERPSHTWQPTALVHEAFLRLGDHPAVRWQDRRHFFAVVARTMRRLLVDHARRRDADKRGGGIPALCVETVAAPMASWDEDLIALDHSLTDLYSMDPLKGWIVELRYFGGYSVDETAEMVGVSRATVIRQWRVARAWLYRSLRGEAPPADGSTERDRGP